MNEKSPPPISKNQRLRYRATLIILLILTFAAYANTLRQPFHFDDLFNIDENPMIRDFGFFKDPSMAEGYVLHNAMKSRYVGFLSFALNYRIHGLDTLGYHLTNIAIHMVNVILVYAFIMALFRTERVTDAVPEYVKRPAALLASALFALHPIETQAVTYIVQRFASLCTLFYMLSFLLYASARAGEKGLRPVRYALSVFSALLAVKTKEISVSLPFVLLLYEYIFMKGGVKKRALMLAPYFLLLVLIPLSFIGSSGPVSAEDGSVMSLTKVQTGMSRLDYLYTEFTVLARYLRLLVLPVGQNLDYDYPLRTSFLNPGVFLSFVFLVVLLVFAVLMVRRSRSGNPALAVPGFGIFWFFATILPESGLIPIVDVIFEHRVYLPSIGLFAGVSAGAALLYGRLGSSGARLSLVAMAVISVLALGTATHMRNRVWESELTLWADVVEKAPGNARAHTNLGHAYLKAGMSKEAISDRDGYVEKKPGSAEGDTSLGVAYLSSGEAKRAIEEFQIAIGLDPGYVEAYTNLGGAYLALGRQEEAVSLLVRAVRLKPKSFKARTNLGLAYLAAGKAAEAIGEFSEAVAVNPGSETARQNLAKAYAAFGDSLLSKGDTRAAIARYLDALETRPDYAAAMEGLGKAYRAMGRFEEALRWYESAVRAEPGSLILHNNAANAYLEAGLPDKAIGHYGRALSLSPGNPGVLTNLGLAYMKAGRLDDAARVFDEILARNPGDTRARRYLDRIDREKAGRR